MKNAHVILSGWLSLSLFTFTYAVPMGEDCTVGQLNGICVLLRHCPELNSQLQQQQRPISAESQALLQRKRCGFQNRESLVCCSKRSSTYRTTTTIAPDPEVPDVRSHLNFRLINFKSCGLTDPLPPRIINGDKTGIFEFPWMARLKIRSWRGDRFVCGGTLINDRYILTAAHCIPSTNSTSLVSVSLGDHDYTTERDCTSSSDEEEPCAPLPQNIAIAATHVHPMYSYNSSFLNDIALVRLARPANFTAATVRPICLPTGKAVPVHNLEGLWLTIAGWGQTLNATESPDLLKVNVPVVSNSRCNDLWNRYGTNVTNHQLCAGDASLIRGSCRGDSGGPYMTAGRVDSELKMVQYGIISFGPSSCENTNVPVVYTRVDHYMTWILDTLRP